MELFWVLKPEVRSSGLAMVAPVSSHAIGTELRGLLFSGGASEASGELIDELEAMAPRYWLAVVGCCHDGRQAQLLVVVAPDGSTNGSSRRSPHWHLRRKLDKHAVITEHTVAYAPGRVLHRAQCPLPKGPLGVYRSEPDPSGGSKPTKPSTPSSWGFATTPGAHAVTSGGRSWDEEVGNASAHLQHNSSRNMMMTALLAAGLLTLGGNRSLMKDFSAVGQWLELMQVSGQGPRLPDGVTFAEVFLCGESAVLAAARHQLNVLKPRFKSYEPLIAVLAVFVKLKRSKAGGYTATQIDVHGDTTEIELPPDVAVWTDDTRTVRAPFLGLLRIRRGSGGVKIVAGYLHPITSIDCLITVEAHGERSSLATLLKWHNSLPSHVRPLICIEKLEFSYRFRKGHINPDFVITFSLPASAPHLLAFVERLGSLDPAYRAKKKRDEHLAREAAPKSFYLWDGEMRYRSWWTTRTLAEQLQRLMTSWQTHELY